MIRQYRPGQLICITLLLVTILTGCGSTASTSSRPIENRASLIASAENRIAEALVRQLADDLTRLEQDPCVVAVSDNGTPPALTARLDTLDTSLQMIHRSVNIDLLTDANKAMVDLIRYAAETERGGLKLSRSDTCINPLTGPQATIPMRLVTTQPLTDSQDFEDYIALIETMPIAIQASISASPPADAFFLAQHPGLRNAITYQCEALAHGTPFADERENSAKSTAEANTADGTLSPLWEDFEDRLQAATALPDAGRQALSQHARRALVASITTGCTLLDTYFDAGDRPDLVAPASGSEHKEHNNYAHRLKQATSLNISPADAEAIVVSEYERIRQQIANMTDHTDSAVSEESPASSQDLLDNVSNFVFLADGSLGDITNIHPRSDLEIRKLYDFQKPWSKSSIYLTGAGAKAPAIALIDLAAPRNQLEAVTYYTTVPGMHLVPETPLTQVIRVPAFTGGWALYSLELLPSPPHFSTSAAKAGALQLALTATADALIDLRLHQNTLSPDQAVDFIAEVCQLPSVDAQRHVLRILSTPAESVAPVLGAHTIRRLRRQAEQQLGGDFSQPAFNDQLLATGAMPLPLVEARIKSWLASLSTGKMTLENDDARNAQ